MFNGYRRECNYYSDSWAVPSCMHLSKLINCEFFTWIYGFIIGLAGLITGVVLWSTLGLIVGPAVLLGTALLFYVITGRMLIHGSRHADYELHRLIDVEESYCAMSKENQRRYRKYLIGVYKNPYAKTTSIAEQLFKRYRDNSVDKSNELFEAIKAEIELHDQAKAIYDKSMRAASA